MKLDGRRAGNTPMGTLARLSGEIAYTQKRLCLRDIPAVLELLSDAQLKIEQAMQYVEQNEALVMRSMQPFTSPLKKIAEALKNGKFNQMPVDISEI